MLWAAMTPKEQRHAAQLRSELQSGHVTPLEFRAALLDVAPSARDAWLDHVLGLQEIYEDGTQLPRGSAPYLPASVDSIVAAVDRAAIGPQDVFVDIGSGVGRAGVLVALLSGAEVIGIEIQSRLVAEARRVTRALKLQRVGFVEGDVREQLQHLQRATVLFLYCPFSGERLHEVVDELGAVARKRKAEQERAAAAGRAAMPAPIRLCAVDLRIPQRDWFVALTSGRAELEIFEQRSFL